MALLVSRSDVPFKQKLNCEWSQTSFAVIDLCHFIIKHSNESLQDFSVVIGRNDTKEKGNIDRKRMNITQFIFVTPSALMARWVFIPMPIKWIRVRNKSFCSDIGCSMASSLTLQWAHVLSTLVINCCKQFLKLRRRRNNSSNQSILCSGCVTFSRWGN